MPSSFSLTDLQPIIDFLHYHCGLDFDQSNNRQLAQAVQNRMAETGRDNLSSYIRLLKSSLGAIDEEFSHLVEAVTIGETYFYRIRAHFNALQHFVFPQFSAKNQALSILSAACSSGEEPYGIALLLSHYFPTLRFVITAVDIDRNSLALAQLGRYNQRSVKNLPKVILDSYFRRVGQYYYLADRIKKKVHFRSLNLFDSQMDLVDNSFDVIFCRNVLIYFSAQKISELTARLYQLNRSNGYLFLGDAETLRGYNDDYQLVEYDSAFFYRKNEPQAQGNKPIEVPVVSPIHTPYVKPIRIAELVVDSSDEPSNVTFLQCVQAYLADQMKLAQDLTTQLLQVQPEHWEAKLLQAMIAAGSGDYERALQLCSLVDNLDEAACKRFFVTGMIEVEAKQFMQAKRSFESALFHDRAFFPAHFRLALLYQRLGEHSKAKKSFTNVLKTMARCQQDYQLYVGEFPLEAIARIAQAACR